MAGLGKCPRSRPVAARASPNALPRAVTWGVTDVANGRHWGAGAARVIETKPDGSVVIAAVAEGVFEVNYGTHGETLQQLANKEANDIVACASLDWRADIQAIKVVGRAGSART